MNCDNVYVNEPKDDNTIDYVLEKIEKSTFRNDNELKQINLLT